MIINELGQKDFILSEPVPIVITIAQKAIEIVKKVKDTENKLKSSKKSK